MHTLVVVYVAAMSQGRLLMVKKRPDEGWSLPAMTVLPSTRLEDQCRRALSMFVDAQLDGRIAYVGSGRSSLHGTMLTGAFPGMTSAPSMGLLFRGDITRGTRLPKCRCVASALRDAPFDRDIEPSYECLIKML